MSKKIILPILFCCFVVVTAKAEFSSAKDSLAFKAFFDGSEKNAQEISTFSCVMKTILDISAFQEKTGPKIPLDTTTIRMWTKLPGYSRSEIKSKLMNMTMVSNGRSTFIKDSKTGTIQQLDSLAAKQQTGTGQVTVKDILKCFSGKLSFKVLPGDSLAQMKGKFALGNQSGLATLLCNLKKYTVKEYTVQTSAALVTAKLKYAQIGSILVIKRMDMETAPGGKIMKIATVFDSIKVNMPIDTNIFQIK